MGVGNSIFKKIKELLFGKGKEKPYEPPRPAPSSEPSQPQKSIDKKPSLFRRQEPYFFQIGFDFGTSFCKCVCRDVMTNKAWIYFPPDVQGVETPFLIPTLLLIQNEKIRYPHGFFAEYQESGLPHLKLALVKIALEQWDDPVLIPYRAAMGKSCITGLADFVKTCAIYYLAGALGNVREDLRRKFPDFGLQSQDYMAVNLAVPVADAQRPEVERLYQKVLCAAWALADKMAAHPPLSLKDVGRLICEGQEQNCSDIDEACFIYPEVSANVQGFVRSRASSPGIYLFSDTGAGSVDQGVFIFFRQDGKEHLTFLHGSVLPEGSSHIEHLAAMTSGEVNSQALEFWRKRKEAGGNERELQKARDFIGERVSSGTKATLAWAKKKLYVEKQFYDLRVIFGGGGHCEYPYKAAVMKPFSGNLFPPRFEPDIVGLPIPADLELGSNGMQWMRRLSVAYGLSFVRTDLSDFTYPKDVKNPEPTEIQHRFKKLPEAPTKDVC